MPGRAAELDQLPPAGDMENKTQMTTNVENVLNKLGIFEAKESAQQLDTFNYAAAGTSTGASVPSMPEGDGIARDPRKREDAEGQVRFRSASPERDENRLMTGSQEYRNAREQMVSVFTKGETKRNSDG